MYKRIITLLLSFIILTLTACSDDTSSDIAFTPSDTDATWSIYWYLCGSDLESYGAFATTDLEEMLEVELPENVNIVIQTGGATVWQNDLMMLLGTDNDIVADWENGIFYDNFRGVWGAIDGNLVYMELSFEGDDYNLYSVPVLLNDELYNLQVAYDFTEETWEILGATQALDESGMASKIMHQLQEDDIITTIWKIASYSGDDDFEMYTVDEITVTADTTFEEAPLFDGSYLMVFEMWDSVGNYAYSDAVSFDVIEGEIWTTVYED